MIARIVLVLWFLFSAVNFAHAGLVAAAISAFASTTLGGIIVNAVVGIALSIGSNLLKKLFTKTPDKPQPSTTLSMQVGGDNPLEFPLGASANAGLRIYAGSWGNSGNSPNEYVVDVVRVSSMPGTTMQGFWINDQRVTVMTGETKQPQGWPIAEYRKNGKDYAWVDYYDGTQTVAPAYLVSKFGTHDTYPWTTNMIGRGLGIFVVTLRFEEELYQGGYPTFLCETSSIPLYDIRKDSTAGGSGTHRWGQFNTYEPSNNRMVQAYNVIRGIYYGTEWVYGGQNWPAFRLPASSWMAAMNACDTAIPLNGGGTEPQFHGGGIVQCNIVPTDTVDELLRSSSGLIAEIGGIFKVRVGPPGAPVYAFTDANVVVTREQGYSPFPQLSDTFNIVNLSYSEKTQRWATKESPERRSVEYIAEDGGRELPISIELPWVQSNTTVQRIGATALKNGRRWRRHQQYFPPEAWLLEPLDTVSWSSEHNGYIDKEFEIEEISGEMNFLQFLQIRENDPTDYDWNPSTDQYPYSVAPLVTVRPSPQVATGWSLLPAIKYDNNGIGRRPAIKLTYAGGLADVAFVRVQLRLAGETDIFFDATVPYDATSLTPEVLLGAEVTPATEYEGRGIFIPKTGRATLWSNQSPVPPYAEGPWLSVTTLDIKLQPGLDFDPYSGVVGFDQLGDDLAAYQGWIGEELRQLINQAQAQATITGDQELANYADRQRLRREVTSTFNTAKATWNEDILAATGPNSSLVIQINTLNAQITDINGRVLGNASAVQLLQTSVEVTNGNVNALNGTVVSIANAVTALSAADASGNVNTANFRMTAQTGPSGYSRIGAETRQGGAGGWRGAAWYLDTPNNAANPTRFVVDAQQFIVIAGSNLQQPLVVDSGGLKIANAFVRDLTAANILVNSLTADRLNVTTLSTITANVGTLTAGIIRSADSKMIINLNTATISGFT